ncbi:MAG: DUF1501 domain-containing protein [Rubripirellula sp.]|nr:hypothetical protein [Rhodopirellula sp.]MCH1439711.1 DUF1501 domain-containing protein [Rubripirellula sp.]OUX04783.1 MAG: hypothetical protein CBE00_11800 [Planctomycetaceae bacterium TMED240]
MSIRPTLINRRTFAANAGLGAASIALQSLLADEHEQASNALAPHHQPTARSVIFLFMSGGPSQVDTFDPKPDLAKLAGQDVPDSLAKKVPRIKRAGLSNLLASPWNFQQQGNAGVAVSDLLPKLGKHADELCVIRSMTHRNPVHGPGECVALTGTSLGDRPSLGAWSIYGLGSETQELPAFITMNLHTDGMQFPQAAGWNTGFLPPKYQGTLVDPSTGILHAKLPANVSKPQREQELRAIQSMNRKFYSSTKLNELEARMRSYETAFKMQTSAPELFAIGQETAETHALYGCSGKTTREVGRACLIARRMVQRGVRYIQIRVGGWDAHGNLKGNHEKMAARTDIPIAALLSDLKRTGLLENTLVVWGGEFGRTPTMEGRSGGRDHSPTAYTTWLAGGGTQGGQTIGRTDPIGYTVTERPVKPLDLHATILHALGIDAKQLVFDHHGLQENPLGVSGGSVVSEVFNPK